jgi:hypothetical protein
MKNIIIVFLLFSVAHIVTWFQMNLQFKVPWLKDNIWVLLLFSVPIGYMFIKGVQYAYLEYEAVWPARILGFCIGNTIFAIMTYLFMNEGMNTKTLICLSLSTVIILIQVLWK